MSDPLFDDVKELLEKEKGDERILKQILRACENNEVISNYERNYVRKLAEKHLGRKPVFEKKPEDEKPSTPDVAIPKPVEIPKPQILQTQSTATKPKSSKMIFGIAAAVIITVIVIGVAAYQFSDISISDVTKPVTPVEQAPFTIDTDSKSYQKKDLISISGMSKTSNSVTLTIENQDGTLVWSEQVKTKSDGKFSTLAIAAGDGWDKSGTFTLKAENDSGIISKSFSFKV